MGDIDWSSDLALTNPGSASPKAVLGAIDKALVMGAAMDAGALKEAAAAHVQAIGSMDAKGVTTQADFAAINAGLGKAIASVPTSKVMDVYNAFGKVMSPDVPNYLMRTVNAGTPGRHTTASWSSRTWSKRHRAEFVRRPSAEFVRRPRCFFKCKPLSAVGSLLSCTG